MEEQISTIKDYQRNLHAQDALTDREFCISNSITNLLKKANKPPSNSILLKLHKRQLKKDISNVFQMIADNIENTLPSKLKRRLGHDNRYDSNR